MKKRLLLFYTGPEGLWLLLSGNPLLHRGTEYSGIFPMWLISGNGIDGP